MGWPVLHTIPEEGKLLIHVMTLYFLSYSPTHFLCILTFYLLFWLQLHIEQGSSLSCLQWGPGVFLKLALLIEISGKVNEWTKWTFVTGFFSSPICIILHLKKWFSPLLRWPIHLAWSVTSEVFCLLQTWLTDFVLSANFATLLFTHFFHIN